MLSVIERTTSMAGAEIADMDGFGHGVKPICIQVIIVNDGSPIATLDDLWNFDENGDPVSLKNPDIKIGVQQDTTGDIFYGGKGQKPFDRSSTNL